MSSESKDQGMSSNSLDGALTSNAQGAATGVESKSAYRKQALTHYRKLLAEPHFNLCVVCGFGVQAVLEVAHLDQKRTNNAIENLAVLCPNCHKMHDIGLIPGAVVKTLRDQKAEVSWKLRIKDAGVKAALKRKATAKRAKKSAAAKKAWTTRLGKGQQKP